MFENFSKIFQNFYDQHFAGTLALMYQYPIKIVIMLLDIGIVLFLAYKFFKLVKDTRVWQLIKGIVLLIVANVLSGFLQLNILYMRLFYRFGRKHLCTELILYAIHCLSLYKNQYPADNMCL